MLSNHLHRSSAPAAMCRYYSCSYSQSKKCVSNPYDPTNTALFIPAPLAPYTHSFQMRHAAATTQIDSRLAAAVVGGRTLNGHSSSRGGGSCGVRNFDFAILERRRQWVMVGGGVGTFGILGYSPNISF